MIRCLHCYGIVMNFKDGGDNYSQDDYRCMNCGREDKSFAKDISLDIPGLKDWRVKPKHSSCGRCSCDITLKAKFCKPCLRLEMLENPDKWNLIHKPKLKVQNISLHESYGPIGKVNTPGSKR